MFQKNDTYQLRINNLGDSNAKNVLINFEEKGVNFTNFTSSPYLSKHMHYNTSRELGLDKGFVEIDNLPAFSSTTIFAKVNKSNTQSIPSLSISLRSDEQTGKRNTNYLLLDLLHN